MSGGDLDYISFKLNRTIEELNERRLSPIHRAFIIHMHKVSKALHDIEWVLSGDMSPGDDLEAIKSVIYPIDILKTVMEEANKIKKDLDGCIQEYKKLIE